MRKNLFCALLLFFGCRPPPPNVIFILVDDLGWTDLGCYGSTFYETPHIDRLAKAGKLFTDAYAASPVCSPTRAALMTGKHPARLHITDWIPGMSTDRIPDALLSIPEDVHQLPLAETTLAEKFESRSYRTFFAGKWHLGESAEYWPLAHGFQSNVAGNAWGSPGRFHSENGYYSPYGNPQLQDGPPGEYLTDRLTDEVIQFIEQESENPFFAYLAYYTVHTPIVGCAKFDAYFNRKKNALPDSGLLKELPEHGGRTRINQSDAKYAAMVASLDENVGRLMAFLDRKKLTNNTIVVFTSDNGGLSTLRKAGPTAVRPLRAGKGWCYEGGIRVPLIIRYPPQINPGSTSLGVNSMDLYPTLLELCGIPLDSVQHQDGVSILSLVNEREKIERTMVWHYPHYHGSTWRPGSAIREGAWKLIHFYEENKQELYHLDNDISEQNDLCTKHPEKCRKMKIKLFNYLHKMDAQFPTAKN